MMFSCSRLRVLPICWVFLAIPLRAYASDPQCNATDTEPVKVCFANPPLTIDHCHKLIRPDFIVSRKRRSLTDDAFYYFTYQLTYNGSVDPIVDPFEKKQQKYILSSDNAPKQAAELGLPQIPYHGPGPYNLKVTVHVDGRPDVIERESGAIPLVDRPVVRSVVVGISNYADPSASTLLHADSDARTFETLLKSLFPASPAPVLLTSDSTDQKNLPTPTNITVQLQQLASDDQELCTADDWFVFYFSGHGIVAFNSNGNQFSHYLSTETFDPALLRSTAIRITDLLNAVRNIPARNKLVILDSCFSGSSSRPPDANGGSASNTGGLPPATTRRGRKVAYVQDEKLVPAFQIAAPDPATLGGDTRAFDANSQLEELDNVHVLYLSAAGADHEAEEGYASYQNGLTFLPVEKEETQDQKTMGHSLFTYSWIWNLLKQTPKGLQLPNLPGNLPKPAQTAGCSIDFEVAANNTISQVDDLRLSDTAHKYQHPEISGHTPHLPGPVECQVLQEH